MDGLVGHRDVARVAVGVGIDRDRLDAEPPRRLDDPAGDLAAIGDQDLGEHLAYQSGSYRRGAACAWRFRNALMPLERLLGDANCVGDVLAAGCRQPSSVVRHARRLLGDQLLDSASAPSGAPSFSSLASAATRRRRARAARPRRPGRPGRCAAPSRHRTCRHASGAGAPGAVPPPRSAPGWRCRPAGRCAPRSGRSAPTTTATAKSQASIRPMPPPTAAPWTRAIDGLGKS